MCRLPEVPWRWRVVALCAGSNLICYADRVNISVAIVAMAKEFDWSLSDEGVIMAAFSAGYVCTQVLGGWASQPARYGGARVLAVGVFLWSLFTAMTPFAARAGMLPLLAARVGMGLGEGVAMPSIHSLLGAWVPPAEVSRGVALATSGQHLGTVTAMLSAPLTALNWAAVFYGYGLIGCLYAVLLWNVAAATPRDHKWISPGEVVHIEASIAAASSVGAAGDGVIALDRGASGASSGGSGRTAARARYALALDDDGRGSGARAEPGIELTHVEPELGALDGNDNDDDGHDDDGERLTAGGEGEEASRGLRSGSHSVRARAPAPSMCAYLTQRPVWAILIAHFCHNFAFVAVASWLPTYLTRLGTTLGDAGLWAVTPFATAVVAANLWSQFVDRLLARGVLTQLGVRRVSQTVGFMAPISAYLVLAMTPLKDTLVPFAMMMFTIALGVNAVGLTGFFANIVDLAPMNAGALCGIDNTVGNLGSLLAPAVSGWLLDATHENWAAVWVLAAAMCVCGLVAYLALSDTRVLFQVVRRPAAA